MSSNSITSNPSNTIARLYQPAPCSDGNTINCIGVSPCTYTNCPAYPDAICRDDNCGHCSAIFYDSTTGAELTYRQCIFNRLPLPAITSAPKTTTKAPAAMTATKAPGAGATSPTILTPATNATIIITNANGTIIKAAPQGLWPGQRPTTTESPEGEGGEEGGGEEGYEYEYPQQVDQYQKTRDNYGINLNDEMIDIGRDLINYGDLDIDVAWPYTLQGLSNALKGQKIIRAKVPCTPSNTTKPPCIRVNTTNGTIYYQVVSTEEIGDDPVVNDYTIDNVQKTRDNMGLNLNDEVVDIGRDLINYGTLHYRMVPVSEVGSNLYGKDPPSSQLGVFTAPMPVPGEDDVISPCAQDEKICEDGSAVFRVSVNNCEFTPCPTDILSNTPQDPHNPNPNPNPIPVPQSAKSQTMEQQLADELIIPCILDDERKCGEDADCCGDGICDINGACVKNMEFEDGRRSSKEMMGKLILIGVVLGIIVFCVLPLLYWCYCKQCKLPNSETAPKREILDDVETQI